VPIFIGGPGSTTMKLSRYTIFVPHYPASGEYLAFNTLTGSMAVVNRKLKDAIKRLDSGEQVPEAHEYLCTLEELGILVADNTDEDLLIRHRFDELIFDRSSLDVMVLTTYACNFACIYCVEEGVKGDIRMDCATCESVVEWVARRLQGQNPQILRVSFYGGEPLMNIPAIELINEGLYEVANRAGIIYQSDIVTNGSLLTVDLVDRLSKYGLKGVKVTLDGDRAAHNRKRPFKDGRGSFDRIMGNIMGVAGRVGVMIGGNFDRENLEALPRLLDHLEDRGLKEKIAAIEFKPIIATVRSSPVRDGGCTSLSDAGLPEQIVALKKEVLKRGFKATTGLGVNLCGMMQQDSSFIIDPTGKIYKCPALVGHEDFVIGDIHQGHFEPNPIEPLLTEVWEQCIDCTYLPLCGGGCRYIAYLKYGDLNHVDCEREYFERTTHELLKIEYELSISRRQDTTRSLS